VPDTYWGGGTKATDGIQIAIRATTKKMVKRLSESGEERFSHRLCLEKPRRGETTKLEITWESE